MRYVARSQVPFLFLLFLIGFSLLDTAIPGARYLKYVSIPYSLVMTFSHPFILEKLKWFAPFLLYLSFSGVYSFVDAVVGGQSSIDDFIFTLSYVAPFLLYRSSISLNKVFVFLVFIFFFASVGKFGSLSGFSLLDSESPLEHHEFGFIFSLFFIYFFCEKRYRWMLLSLVLMLLCMKRIALLGVALAILTYELKWVMLACRFRFSLVMAFINLLFIWVARYIASPEFNDLSLSLFSVGANQLTMGRVVLYSYIFENMQLGLLSGAGPGSVYALAGVAFDSTSRILLHSDILKLAFEYGLIFVWAFIFLLYYSRLFPRQYAVFLNVLLLTDNALIYGGVMFFVVLVSISGRDQSVRGVV